MNMKKIIFATILVAMLPLLFSCGKPSSGENQLEDPRFIQYAGKLVPRGGEPAPSSRISQFAATPSICYLEFTESGLFALGRKLLGGIEYISGTYTTTDGLTFTLSNGLTVTLSGTSGEVNVTVSPSGETFKADFIRAGSTNVAYRAWAIDKVRITIRRSDNPVTAEFNGCNFTEIEKFLNDNGYEGDFLPDCSLSSVSFTGVNSVLFAFSDNVVDVGSCTISGNNASFSWTSQSRIFEAGDGRATISYMDGKCIFRVDADLKGPTAESITFVMSPVK
jgi:hypothetical protein